MLNLIQQLFLTSSHARLRYWGAMASYVLILIIGSIPGARADMGEVASGIVLHSCAYATLAFLLFTGGSGNPAQRALKAVLTVAVMGALDEIVQSFFPYRHGSIQDWCVDCSAAIVCATFMWALWSHRKVAA
ncbi:VanZ family protein [Massilia sp. erpn]|nr:hypothetical protein ACZ75_12725 [Massilia sp. NR 4-1]NVE01404.1 VanZ family protein [Massilia sp. BJB1822]UTY56021.1 VanZ family protein [Massilia sp. erpn]